MSDCDGDLRLDVSPAVLSLRGKRVGTACVVSASDPLASLYEQCSELLDEAARRRRRGWSPLRIRVVVPPEAGVVRQIEGLPQAATAATAARIVATSPRRFFVSVPGGLLTGPVARDDTGALRCAGFDASFVAWIRDAFRRRALTLLDVRVSVTALPPEAPPDTDAALALHDLDPPRVTSTAGAAAGLLACFSLISFAVLPAEVHRSRERAAELEYDRLLDARSAAVGELRRRAQAATLAAAMGAEGSRTPSPVGVLSALSRQLPGGSAVQAITLDSQSVTLTLVGPQLEGILVQFDSSVSSGGAELVGPVSAYGAVGANLQRATIRLRAAPPRGRQGGK